MIPQLLNLFNFSQSKYLTYFTIWQNIEFKTGQQIQPTRLAQLRAQFYLGPQPDADISRGVCLGITCFIFKMLYTQGSDGAIPYAHQFLNDLRQQPIIEINGQYHLNSLLEIFSKLVKFNASQELKFEQAKEQHEIWQQNLLKPISPYQFSDLQHIKKFHTNFDYDSFVNLYKNLLMIPSSFWFFIKLLWEMLESQKYLFCSEIVKMQGYQGHVNSLLKRFMTWSIWESDAAFSTRESLLKVRNIPGAYIELSSCVELTYTPTDTQEMMFEKNRRLADQFNKKIECMANGRIANLDASTPANLFQMIYFIAISINSIFSFAHSICAWKLKEIKNGTTQYRTFLWDANFGLFEVQDQNALGSAIIFHASFYAIFFKRDIDCELCCYYE